MKYIIYVISFILILICFFQWKYPKIEIIEKEIIKRDTITLVDTLFIEKPVYKTVYTHSTDTVYLPSEDTTMVLQQQTKIYEDSTYKAQISGYNPSLDWIETYNNTKYIYEEMVRQGLDKKYKSPKNSPYLTLNQQLD